MVERALRLVGTSVIRARLAGIATGAGAAGPLCDRCGCFHPQQLQFEQVQPATVAIPANSTRTGNYLSKLHPHRSQSQQATSAPVAFPANPLATIAKT